MAANTLTANPESVWNIYTVSVPLIGIVVTALLLRRTEMAKLRESGIRRESEAAGKEREADREENRAAQEAYSSFREDQFKQNKVAQEEKREVQQINRDLHTNLDEIRERLNTANTKNAVSEAKIQTLNMDIIRLRAQLEEHNG